MDTWYEIGSVDVDSGTIWLGDPCYIIHRDGGLSKELGKDWGEYCDMISKRKFFDKQHLELIDGVLVATAHGDGSYPVYIRKTRTGRIAEVKIVFEE